MRRIALELLTFCFFLSTAAICRAQVDVVELTAQQLAVGYEQNQYTAVEVTQAYLDRINAFELNYNAFTNMAPDVLAIAAALDEERATSGPRGPLHGVPVVIKESIDVAGLPSTAGLRELSSHTGGIDLIAPLDAPVVARLRDAGAIILGKTNIPGYSADGTRTNNTFISSWDGTTYNSYDRTLAPGASSAGTATAVSASFGALGIGEETGGSIQNPSGAQNLVGIKPTFGLVPNVGVVPIGGSTRDVLGPIARTVYDAALTLDVIAGPTDKDSKTLGSAEHIPEGGYGQQLSTSALDGKRIGIYGSGWRLDRPSSSTQALYDEALSTLVAEGAVLVEDPFAGTDFRTLAIDFFGVGDLRGHESIVYDNEQYFDRLLSDSQPTALSYLQALTGVNLFEEDGLFELWVETFPVARESLSDPDASPDLSEFLAIQTEYREIFSAVMVEHDLDAFVYPQMLSQTPRLTGTDTIASSTVDALNILGVPGVTVPAGYYDNGSPFSLMFMGDLFSEAELIALAYDYEQATLHRTAPELLHVADADQDGEVGFSDFLILSENFGKRTSGTRRGDFNADRSVDFADFLFLSKHFGYGTSEAESVPEPAGFGLIIVAAVCLMRCQRSRSLRSSASQAEGERMSSIPQTKRF